MDFTDGFVGEEIFTDYEPPVEYWMDGETLVRYSEQPGIKTAHIPSTVKVIGSNAFRDCCNITSVIVPYSVKAIKTAAFQGCKSLKEIQLPNTITQLENNTFRDCKSLESIMLPQSVKSIGDRAFMGCTNLKSFSGEGLTFIGKDAFKNCKSLTSLPKIEQQALDNQGEGLLKDKIVVHTGFSKADEDRITKITTAAGGTVKSSVVLKTDILVYNPGYDHETTKLKRAKELNECGKNIKIVRKAATESSDTALRYAYDVVASDFPKVCTDETMDEAGMHLEVHYSAAGSFKVIQFTTNDLATATTDAFMVSMN